MQPWSILRLKMRSHLACHDMGDNVFMSWCWASALCVLMTVPVWLINNNPFRYTHPPLLLINTRSQFTLSSIDVLQMSHISSDAVHGQRNHLHGEECLLPVEGSCASSEVREAVNRPMNDNFMRSEWVTDWVSTHPGTAVKGSLVYSSCFCCVRLPPVNSSLALFAADWGGGRQASEAVLLLCNLCNFVCGCGNATEGVLLRVEQKLKRHRTVNKTKHFTYIRLVIITHKVLVSHHHDNHCPWVLWSCFHYTTRDTTQP